MKQKLFLILPIFLVLALFGVASYYQYPVSPQQSQDGVKFRNDVCIYKNGELIGCDHNLVYNNGLNMTRDMLGFDANYSIRNISLCNASAGCGAPLAGANEGFTAFLGCGMGSKEGTYGVVQTTGGNWTVYASWTSTCDNVVTNLTRLGNQSGAPFAGNNFNLVNLSNTDQLTVNWTISVS